MPETETREFFNPHQGVKGRDGGPYLDIEEREQAEIRRANREGREPDLDPATMPAVAGTPLVTEGELIDNSILGNPSMVRAEFAADTGPSAHKDDNEFFEPPVELPVSTGGVDEAPSAEEIQAAKEAAIEANSGAKSEESMQLTLGGSDTEDV